MKVRKLSLFILGLTLICGQLAFADGGPADLGPEDIHSVSKIGLNQKILVIYVQANDYRILPADLATQITSEDTKVTDFADWYNETSWGKTTFVVTQQRDAGGNWYTLPEGILDYIRPSAIPSMESRDAVQASATNPTPPASVTAAAAAPSGSDPASDFDATEAGNYWYAVASFRNGVESTLRRVGAALTVAEGDIVKLAITKAAANDVDRYLVYRTDKGAADLLGNYKRIGYADVAAATDEYIDLGTSLDRLADHYKLLTAAMTAADADVANYEDYNAVITIIYSTFLRGQASGAQTFTIGGTSFKIQTINQSSTTGFGRFTHEIGHWIGLPDEYDPITAGGRGYWTTMDGADDREYAGWEKDYILAWITNPPNVKALSRPAVGSPDLNATYKVVPTAIEETAGDTYTAIKINSSASVNYYVEGRDAIAGNVSDAGANNQVVVMEAVDAWPPGLYPKRNLNEQKVMTAGAAAHKPDPSIEITYVSNNPGPPESYNVNVKIKAPEQPDPSITPWGAPPWETIDVWIDSEREGGGWDDPATAVLKPSNGEAAWVNHVNRIYAKIANVGHGDATGVSVRFKVNTPGGIGDAGQFVDLVTPASVDIPAGTSRNVYAEWTPTVGSHTCIQVEIEHIPGEEDIYNNFTQENVTHFYSGSSSPWHAVTFPVRVANPFDEPKRVDLEIDGLKTGWNARLSNKWVDLAPKSIKTIDVTITPPADAQECTQLNLDLYGMTQIDDYIQVYGGMNPIVHLANPIKFERHGVAPAKPNPKANTQGYNSRWIYNTGGLINPVLAGVEIATIITNPQGKDVVYFDTTDANGTFDNTFPTDRPGTWAAYSYYAGDSCNAPTESERVVFTVPYPGIDWSRWCCLIVIILLIIILLILITMIRRQRYLRA